MSSNTSAGAWQCTVHYCTPVSLYCTAYSWTYLPVLGEAASSLLPSRPAAPGPAPPLPVSTSAPARPQPELAKPVTQLP